MFRRRKKEEKAEGGRQGTGKKKLEKDEDGERRIVGVRNENKFRGRTRKRERFKKEGRTWAGGDGGQAKKGMLS